jgi:adenine-specific DNA-methyltransferase
MPTLHWLTRDEDQKVAKAVPYRLLEEVPSLGAGDSAAGNLLIQGDNLEALKALLPFYAGRVKCIYIDPPYNTRSAFEHYDDNLEHTYWPAMIKGIFLMAEKTVGGRGVRAQLMDRFASPATS